MNTYFHYTVTQSINQEYGKSLQTIAPGNHGRVFTKDYPAFQSIPYAAMSLRGVVPRRVKALGGRGKAAKANIDVKSRGDVRCLPQANMRVKSRGGVRLLGGREIHGESAKGAKWLLS